MKLGKSYHSYILKATTFFLLFVLIISCTKDKTNDIFNANIHSTDSISVSNTNTADTGKITYLALGDSYTIGETVPEWEGFPFN